MRRARSHTPSPRPTAKPRDVAKSPRPSNTAKPRDVASILAELIPNGDDSRLNVPGDASFGDFAERHSEFLVRLLALTPRVTAPLVEEACLLQFQPCSPLTASAFGSMVVRTLSHCRRAARSMSSGSKLPPGILRVSKK